VRRFRGRLLPFSPDSDFDAVCVGTTFSLLAVHIEHGNPSENLKLPLNLDGDGELKQDEEGDWERFWQPLAALLLVGCIHAHASHKASFGTFV
jgi:hypothetical protein